MVYFAIISVVGSIYKHSKYMRTKRKGNSDEGDSCKQAG